MKPHSPMTSSRHLYRLFLTACAASLVIMSAMNLRRSEKHVVLHAAPFHQRRSHTGGGGGGKFAVLKSRGDDEEVEELREEPATRRKTQLSEIIPPVDPR